MLRRASFVLAAAAALLPAFERADASADPCAVSSADYTLTGTLELTDTPHGLGNGSYAIGPGKAVLRFEKGNAVKMLAYSMHESLRVERKTIAWKTLVTTTSDSRAAPDACGVVAEGHLAGRRVVWDTPLRAYRTDGTIQCGGAFCGDFGVPARGVTALHVGPAPQKLSDFVFSPDMRTFTMASTKGPTTTSPKQSSAVAVSGTLASRACVSPPTCPVR